MLTMTRTATMGTAADGVNNGLGSTDAIGSWSSIPTGPVLRCAVEVGAELNVVLLVEASFELVDHIGDCCSPACFVHFLSGFYFAHDLVECVLFHSPRESDT